MDFFLDKSSLLFQNIQGTINAVLAPVFTHITA